MILYPKKQIIKGIYINNRKKIMDSIKIIKKSFLIDNTLNIEMTVLPIIPEDIKIYQYYLLMNKLLMLIVNFHKI